MALPFVSRNALLEAEQQYISLQQEFRNYRRRNESLAADSHLKGQLDAAKTLFPVYDNLLRALSQPTEDEAFRKGIEMTMESLKKSFLSLHIQEIPALGEQFDPTIHEAMDHITDPNLGENTIASVVLTGFTREGTVLRHALVVVAN